MPGGLFVGKKGSGMLCRASGPEEMSADWNQQWGEKKVVEHSTVVLRYKINNALLMP